MRVAFTLEHLWHRVPGGTGVYSQGLLGALAEEPDLELVGVAAMHRGAPPAVWTPQVPTFSLPLPRPALYRTWQRLGRPLVELATGRIDLVHGVSNIVPACRAPLVMTLHDLSFVEHPEWFSERGVEMFRHGLELAMRRAAAVLCVSDTTRRAAEEFFEPERLHTVLNGVDQVEATDTDVIEARAATGLKRPYVLFVGTLEPRKNLARLLEAWRSMNRHDLDLVLVGPKGWGDAGGNPVPGVVMPGFVPRRYLSGLYRGAVVMCYPSLLEGFGLPVVEAMVQGTPVVTSSGTATEEVAGGAAVLVDPTDVESIAAGLTAAIELPERDRTRLVAAGRRGAALLTWKNCAVGTAAIYRRTTGG